MEASEPEDVWEGAWPLVGKPMAGAREVEERDVAET